MSRTGISRVATCGGGGGGDAGLGAWWFIDARQAGTSDPFRAFMLVQTAEQDGNLWANGTELVRPDSTLHADDSTSGSVTVTTVTRERLAGTYDLSFGGDAATGVFDAPIRVVQSK